MFGSIDGLVMFLGLTLGLIVSRQDSSAVWHAALGGSAGELAGMTAGQRISAPQDGWGSAVACGASGAAACLAPAVPFLFLARVPALCVALAAACAVAGVIARLRPEHGAAAVLRTYGVLAAAGALSGLTGLG